MQSRITSGKGNTDKSVLDVVELSRNCVFICYFIYFSPSKLLSMDIAGGRVMAVMEVLERPEILQPDVLAQKFPEVFSDRAVTRAQTRRLGEVSDLSETLFATELFDRPASPLVSTQPTDETSDQVTPQWDKLTSETTTMTCSNLIVAQKDDASLARCFATALAPEIASGIFCAE